MTEEEFLNEGGIDVTTMTEEENRLMEVALAQVWKAKQFETVTPERTQALVETFRKESVDEKQAIRLVRHFDAATRFIQEMPQEQKEAVLGRIVEKFGPRPA